MAAVKVSKGISQIPGGLPPPAEPPHGQRLRALLGQKACPLPFDAPAGTPQDQHADVTAPRRSDKNALPGIAQLALDDIHAAPPPRLQRAVPPARTLRAPADAPSHGPIPLAGAFRSCDDGVQP
jgi:hypothetical protein